MDPIKFINEVSKRHHIVRALTVKQLKRFLDKVFFTESIHMMLLKFDAINYSKTWIQDAFDYGAPRGYPVEEELKFSIPIVVPYMAEKLLVQSNPKLNKNIYTNEHILNTLRNALFEGGNFENPDDPNSFINKIFFFYSYEQFTVQDRVDNQLELVRLLRLYKNYPEVNQFVLEDTGLTLEEIVIYTLLLIGHMYHYKKVHGVYPLKNFYQYARNLDGLNDEKTKKFLDFMLITQDEFIDKYNFLRTVKNKEGKRVPIHYNHLQKIDRYIPKVSFLYPFILLQDKKHMLLVSYTSFFQFMKFERLYMYIYQNKKIKDFHARIQGPAIENYLIEYAKEHCSEALSIHGNRKYYPLKKGKEYKRNGQLDEPDLIIEFETYVLIIECKSKPFNVLESIVNYDKYDFTRMKRDVEKSLKNIDNYLEHRNSFKGKKIYRFVAYFYNSSMQIDTTQHELFGMNNVDPEAFIITNIQAIERFFNITSKSKDEVMQNFFSHYKKNKITFFNYIKDNYSDDISSEIIKAEYEKFIKNGIKN